MTVTKWRLKKCGGVWTVFEPGLVRPLIALGFGKWKDAAEYIIGQAGSC